jgi:PAS domain S-box-containing protein
MLNDKTNILIIGAGKGGSLLIELLHKSGLVNIVGVADININAPGMKIAQELGIPTSTNYKDFLVIKEISEIVNVTGSKKIQEELLKNKPPDVEIIGGYSAKFLWNLIEERKHAEEALRESEEIFRAISSTAVDAILLMDNVGMISYWNPSAEKMFGYTSEEARGKELHLFLSPRRYHDAYSDGFKRFKKTGKGPAIGVTSEFFAIKKDGTEFPIEVSTSAIQIKGQWHSVGIIRDITDRKRAEEALLKEKSFTDLAINSLPGIFYIFNDDGRMLKWNRNVEIVSGYSNEEISKMNPLDFFSEEEKNLVEDAIREVFTEGESNVEANLISKEGQKRPYFFTGLRFVSGNQNCLVGMGIDITERKKAEELLRNSEEKYRALFEESKDVIYISIPSGKFIDINPSGVTLFGYSSKEEILQIDIAKDLYVDSFEREKFQQMLERQGYVKDYEVVFKRKDGEHLNVLLTSTAVRDYKGDVIAYRGIMKDITERQRLENGGHRSACRRDCS